MLNTNPIFHAKRKWHLIYVCPQVVAFKGAKKLYHITSNTRTQVTVLGTMSAAGFYTFPHYSYIRTKGSQGKIYWMVLPLFFSNYLTTAGLLQQFFFSWLRDSFILQTQHIKETLLLLVDGHANHKALIETSEICEVNEILFDIAFCRKLRTLCSQWTRIFSDVSSLHGQLLPGGILQKLAILTVLIHSPRSFSQSG